jgi:hypothetical protein
LKIFLQWAVAEYAVSPYLIAFADFVGPGVFVDDLSVCMLRQYAKTVPSTTFQALCASLRMFGPWALRMDYAMRNVRRLLYRL